MASDSEQDYVLVDKSEAQEGHESLRQRNRETAPEAPSTPVCTSGRREAEKASTPQAGGYLEMMQAHIVCVFLMAQGACARSYTAIKQMVPVAVAAMASLGEECARCIKARDWQGLRQLAVVHASSAATQLLSLAQAATPAVQAISLAAYSTALQGGRAVAAAVVFVVQHPRDCWLRAMARLSYVQEACGRAYARVDPSHRLANALASLPQHTVALYNRADPQHTVVAKAQALKAHAMPALHTAATYFGAGVRWAKPHIMAAWERAVPAAQRACAEAADAWAAPGLGWLFLVAGVVGVAGCAVAALFM